MSDCGTACVHIKYIWSMAGTQKTPEEVIKVMLERDRFTKWMGLEVVESRIGYCKLQYRVTDGMLNGFDIVHGGVLFSASDSALAFACNANMTGHISLALDASIHFVKPATAGDLLTVEAIEINRGRTIGVYEIRTTNEGGELVSLFRGTSYQTGKSLAD